MVNPNTVRISGPLWWFVEQCTGLTTTAFSSEYGGSINQNESGSHNTRDGLLANSKWRNDYSIRDPLNKQGPGDKTAAFDWTFPSAQAGNYGAIVLFSARIKVAWEQKDPRTYALFEVLCEADYDYDPEGYVFYPTHRFRVPDRSHKWHIHFGFIRKFLNDWAAFDAIFSIIKGESLAAWKARTGQATGTPTPAVTVGSDVDMFMAQITGNPSVYVSTSMEYRGIDWDTFVFYRDVLKLGFTMVPNEAALRARAGREWTEDEAAIVKGVAATQPMQLRDAMRIKVEAAAEANDGSLTADELRAVMSS